MQLRDQSSALIITSKPSARASAVSRSRAMPTLFGSASPMKRSLANRVADFERVQGQEEQRGEIEPAKLGHRCFRAGFIRDRQ
jgi:hypothetical protein